MLFCAKPTFPVKVSRYIQENPNMDHTRLLDEVVNRTLLSPFEVLDSQYIDALKMFSSSKSFDYNLDFELSEENVNTSIVLMYIRSLVNQIKSKPILGVMLSIIGSYANNELNSDDEIKVDSKGFFEIVNQASIHGVTDVFDCFNDLAFTKLEFQVIGFEDGKLIYEPPVSTQVFQAFELASNQEITECLENPLHSGTLMTMKFTSLLKPILNVITNNTDTLLLASQKEDPVFDFFCDSKIPS